MQRSWPLAEQVQMTWTSHSGRLRRTAGVSRAGLRLCFRRTTDHLTHSLLWRILRFWKTRRRFLRSPRRHHLHSVKTRSTFRCWETIFLKQIVGQVNVFSDRHCITNPAIGVTSPTTKRFHWNIVSNVSTSLCVLHLCSSSHQQVS